MSCTTWLSLPSLSVRVKSEERIEAHPFCTRPSALVSLYSCTEHSLCISKKKAVNDDFIIDIKAAASAYAFSYEATVGRGEKTEGDSNYEFYCSQLHLLVGMLA